LFKFRIVDPENRFSASVAPFRVTRGCLTVRCPSGDSVQSRLNVPARPWYSRWGLARMPGPDRLCSFWPKTHHHDNHGGSWRWVNSVWNNQDVQLQNITTGIEDRGDKILPSYILIW